MTSRQFWSWLIANGQSLFADSLIFIIDAKRFGNTIAVAFDRITKTVVNFDLPVRSFLKFFLHSYVVAVGFVAQCLSMLVFNNSLRRGVFPEDESWL